MAFQHLCQAKVAIAWEHSIDAKLPVDIHIFDASLGLLILRKSHFQKIYLIGTAGLSCHHIEKPEGSTEENHPNLQHSEMQHFADL